MNGDFSIFLQMISFSFGIINKLMINDEMMWTMMMMMKALVNLLRHPSLFSEIHSIFFYLNSFDAIFDVD